MALRVSIGAGRGRLIQLVLVESAWIALLAALAGGLFAWWSAPFVVSRIAAPDEPARLPLSADWRVIAFALAVTLGVTFLFGLAPALRASSVRPAEALKGDASGRAGRRSMLVLIAAQAAFCCIVLFAAGLFAATFQRLSHRQIGFTAERLLALDVAAAQPQQMVYWDQLADHLRRVPGVDKVGLAGSALLAGSSWNGFISVAGAPPGPVLAYFLAVSPGWLDTMKIRLLAGRDLQPTDTSPGEALINETFARQFFSNENPLGRWFAKGEMKFRVVGLVRDVPYEDIHETILPAVYVPFRGVNEKGIAEAVSSGTILVRTSSQNPLALASMLRKEVPRARAEFRVSNLRTQQEIIDAQTVRERLLSMLGLFFAGVALLLAGIGLHGVLDYTVLQRRREIGIRMALGARAGHVARRVTVDVFAMVIVGAAVGTVLGVMAGRSIASLLYQVKVTDASILLLPGLVIFAAALGAMAPAVLRAVRIDPARILRAE
jgi:predicted permease